jgi:hypothetical protein
MSITTEEYVKRAEECERLAGACIADSNREILLYAAGRWRWMAAADPVLAPHQKAMRGSDGRENAGGSTSIR